MKTPREVLFERHRSATTRLDAIRREVVAELATVPEREAKPTITARFLREIFLPLRWHLGAMSALWILAVLLSIEGDTQAPATAQNVSPPSQVFAAVFENRRQLAEMINSPTDEVGTSTSVPQPFIPRRRSAIQPMSLAV